MHSLYRQLCLDHRQFQQLLDALENLLQELASEDRNPETLGLILDALDYLSVYPDMWHHPVEDLIFQRLEQKPLENRAALEVAQREHKEITFATRRMRELFYAVANDCAMERHRLFDATNYYIELQRQHIERENHLVFPMIEKHLSDADWQHVASALQRQRDPLFGPAVKMQYEVLRDYLMSLYLNNQSDIHAGRNSDTCINAYAASA